MRAVRYHRTGEPDVLQVDEIDRPGPGDGEVLIDVAAAGVNPIDTYFRSGEYTPSGLHVYAEDEDKESAALQADEPPDAAALPRIPGSDAAGTVAAVGDGVTDFEAGDRVVATGLGRNRQGSYAEYVPAPVDRVARLPEGVPFHVAGALGVVGVTAWRALVVHAELEPAETVLVHGASGGVGHVATQIAALSGADVVGTASPEHHDKLLEHGATAAFDYRRDDLADAVRDAGRPAVVLDQRFDEYVGFDVAVAAQEARIVAIGNTQPAVTIPSLPDARGKELRVHLMSMSNTPDKRAVLERLVRLVDAGRLTVDVARRYGFDEAADAHREVMDGHFFGKLVLEP